MTEAELRNELSELEKFWKHEVEARGGTSAPLAPADCFWYVYTRQAYLRILGEKVYKPEDE